MKNILIKHRKRQQNCLEIKMKTKLIYFYRCTVHSVVYLTAHTNTCTHTHTHIYIYSVAYQGGLGCSTPPPDIPKALLYLL